MLWVRHLVPWLPWGALYAGVFIATGDWASGLVLLSVALPVYRIIRRRTRAHQRSASQKSPAAEPEKHVPRARRIARIAFRVILALLILALFVYCYGPFAVYASFSPEKKRAASAPAEHLDELPRPPEEWKRVPLGNVSLRLPLADLQGVTLMSKGDMLQMDFGDVSVIVSGVALPEEIKRLLNEQEHEDFFPSFSQTIEYFTSVPDDLSVLKPSSNARTLMSLIIKSIGGAAGYVIVDGRERKVFITKIGTENKRLLSCDVYGPDGKKRISLMFTGMEGANYGKSLKVLGGVELLEKPLDEDQYRKDVSRIHARDCGVAEVMWGEETHVVYGGWGDRIEFLLVFRDDLVLASTYTSAREEKGAEVRMTLGIPGDTLEALLQSRFEYTCSKKKNVMETNKTTYPLSDGVGFLCSLEGKVVNTEQVQVSIDPSVPWRSREQAEAEIRRIVEATPEILKFVKRERP